MRLVIVVLLFTSALVPLVISDISAKCGVDERCLGTPIFLPLKYQASHYLHDLPYINCPNQDHWLVERPNGELACVSEHMAQKTGWYVHYENTVDMRAQVSIWANGMMSFAHFEITGAEFDQIVYEDQKLTATVIPNKETGLLSLDLPFGVPSGDLKYCNPNNPNPPKAPFIVIVNGIEHEYHEGKDSRGQSALNIPLDNDSQTIDIHRTCYEPPQRILETPNGKNPDSCPLSSSSRCYTGIMTEAINGDLIQVNGKISLALIDAPELDENGGQKAKDLIDLICPKGSKVLVDQDDLRPLEGIGGGSIPSAVVHCNGVNLNEQLIKLPEVQLRSALCDASEFAQEPWARDNGCSLNGGTKSGS